MCSLHTVMRRGLPRPKHRISAQRSVKATVRNVSKCSVFTDLIVCSCQAGAKANDKEGENLSKSYGPCSFPFLFRRGPNLWTPMTRMQLSPISNSTPMCYRFTFSINSNVLKGAMEKPLLQVLKVYPLAHTDTGPLGPFKIKVIL